MFRPFHNDRPLSVQNVVQPDGFRIRRPAQAVTVQMVQSLVVLLARVNVNQIECWAGQRRYRAPADPDPGGKDRLAGPHVARKANHISGLKELSKPHTETSGLFCAVCDNVKFAVSEDGHTWLRLGRWVNLERLYYAGQ